MVYEVINHASYIYICILLIKILKKGRMFDLLLKNLMVVFILTSIDVSAQSPKYNSTQQQASVCFKNCKYLECFQLLKTLEAESPSLYGYGRGTMAACCIQLGYSLDSAFYYLYGNEKYPVQSGWLPYPEFEKLESDYRWGEFLSLIKKRYTLTGDTLFMGYKLLLTSIKDQRNRQKEDRNCSYQIDNKEEFWKIIEHDDSINTSFLINFVEKFGWPTISKFGKMPSGQAFWILQHAPLTLQEKYLPVIDSLAALNEVNKWDYVFLADRVMTLKIGLQLYGTQSNEKGLVPLFEPENINIRCKKARIPLWTDEELIQNGIDPKNIKQ